MMSSSSIIGILILSLLCGLYIYRRIRFLVEMNSFWKRQDHAKNLSNIKQLWQTTKGKIMIILFLLVVFMATHVFWSYKS